MDLHTRHRPVDSWVPWAGIVAAVALGFVLLSCAPRPANPFDAAQVRRAQGTGNQYRVRFEVSCRECLISWQAGMDGGSLSDAGTWSHAVYAYPDMGDQSATLSATPAPGSGPVSWIRIRVNGKIVAEARSDEDAGVRARPSQRTLHVETSIPPVEK